MKSSLLRMTDFRSITASIISMKSYNIKSCLPTTWFEERDLFIGYQSLWSSCTIHLFAKKFQKNLSHFEFLHVHRGRIHLTLYLLCEIFQSCIAFLYLCYAMMSFTSKYLPGLPCNIKLNTCKRCQGKIKKTNCLNSPFFFFLIWEASTFPKIRACLAWCGNR